MPKVRLFSISLRYELLTVVSVIGVGCCNGVVEKTGERQKRGPALKGANYTRASTLCLSFIPDGWRLALLRQEKPVGEALLAAARHENATLWAAMAMGPMQRMHRKGLRSNGLMKVRGTPFFAGD